MAFGQRFWSVVEEVEELKNANGWLSIFDLLFSLNTSMNFYISVTTLAQGTIIYTA